MLVTYRFRLYPTRTQERLMAETLQTCRRLYNSLLADRRESGVGFYQAQHSLIIRKSESRYLRAVHSQVLQDVNIRLDKSLEAFFAGLVRFPRFKRNGRYNSFTYPQRTGFKIIGNRLKLSKIGSVKARLHREVIGTPKRCTVIRDVDQWFACIMVEQEEPQRPANVSCKPSVGVDLGVINLVALSDGTLIDNQRFLGHSAERINALQRRISRKERGSNNREKAKSSLAKAWRKVRRQRDDFAHKLSDKLTKENQVIVFEDLKIPNMVKNHNLASAIMDSTWGKLRWLTAYKAERRGGRVILVEPRGTSQKCSGCGEMVPKGLSTRTHRCLRCGLVMDRDVNAARNILKLGLERARAEEQPLLIRRRISKFAPVRQEVH
ncbi:MAG: transposase [Nitrososphaerales archaeon]|nr:transposase [Nitrososphaerales archaeon]